MLIALALQIAITAMTVEAVIPIMFKSMAIRHICRDITQALEVAGASKATLMGILLL